jgi:hypothetical protein
MLPQSSGSVDLWNVGILPQHYTTSQPRGPQLEISPLWKFQISLQSYNIDNVVLFTQHKYSRVGIGGDAESITTKIRWPATVLLFKPGFITIFHLVSLTFLSVSLNRLMDFATYLLTYLLIYLLTYLLTCLLTHSLSGASYSLKSL